MEQLILTASMSLFVIAATQIRAEEPATLLNGTWQYVVAIESERITSYDKSLMQLVIRDNTWAVFQNGRLIQGTVENVEYDRQTRPVSFIRRKGPAPYAVGYAILKVDKDHLMYTTTPLDASRFGATSGAIGDYVPDPKGAGPATVEARTAPNVQTLAESLHEHPPIQFSPEGTRNTQYILRRVGDSTSDIDQMTTR